MAGFLGLLDAASQGHGGEGLDCQSHHPVFHTPLVPPRLPHTLVPHPSPLCRTLPVRHRRDWSRVGRHADGSVLGLPQMPVYSLLETPSSPDLKSRSFLTDDPALVILYAQLRQTTLQTLRGASKVTPKAEWEFVLHSARLYDRMGCDLLGLDLGGSCFPPPGRAWLLATAGFPFFFFSLRSLSFLFLSSPCFVG
jgi:hypothetical protein